MIVNNITFPFLLFALDVQCICLHWNSKLKSANLFCMSLCATHVGNKSYNSKFNEQWIVHDLFGDEQTFVHCVK